MSYATTDDGTCGSNIIPFDDINPGNRGLSGADKQGRYLLLQILHKIT